MERWDWAAGVVPITDTPRVAQVCSQMTNEQADGKPAWELVTIYMGMTMAGKTAIQAEPVNVLLFRRKITVEEEKPKVSL